jgi:hypothetical protein
MLPKLVEADGVTLKSTWATPLAALEHALSLPAVSTAVSLTKYVVPALRLLMLVPIVCPAVGVVVGDETVRKDALGQVGADVAR